jgi:hypothetical protein
LCVEIFRFAKDAPPQDDSKRHERWDKSGGTEREGVDARDLGAGVVFWKFFLVLRRAFSLVYDYAGCGWGQAGLSGFAAGYLAYVQDFFLALLHVHPLFPLTARSGIAFGRLA